MDRKSEVIHQEMEQTRSALADKLETLERKVTGTVADATDVVQTATAAVTDTVASVKDAVQETVDTVKVSVEEAVGTVKEAFDLRRQVEHHPWMMFGGAIAAGFLGERWLYGRGPENIGNTVASVIGTTARAAMGNGKAHSSDDTPRSNGVSQANGAREPASKEQQPASAPGIASLLSAELDQLKKLAIGATLGVVRDTVAGTLAPEFSRPFAQVMDSITTKLGGEPLPAKSPESHANPQEETEAEVGDEVSAQRGFARERAG